MRAPSPARSARRSGAYRAPRGRPAPPPVLRRPRVRRPEPADQRVADPGREPRQLAGRRVELTLRGADRGTDRGGARPPPGSGEQLVDRTGLEADVGIGD